MASTKASSQLSIRPPAERIVLALDLPTWGENRDVLDRLEGRLRWVKVGPILLYREGFSVLKRLTDLGLNLFLDLKFHDIPNTVAGAVTSVCERASIGMLTVHASGGGRMMAAAREALLKLLAVTVLTSLESEDLKRVGLALSPADQAEELARLAMESGADGLVCSPQEVERIRPAVGVEALIVVPGIRSRSEAPSNDDQKRTGTAAETLKRGATHLVIGRPILRASHPLAALEDILREIGTR
jgi:orotidine-5'-phosphate decarboxylase